MKHGYNLCAKNIGLINRKKVNYSLQKITAGSAIYFLTEHE